MDVTDWLDTAVQQTKEKYQEQRALEKQLVQEKALKDRLASKFCEELFAWLETIDVQFNTRFGDHVLTISPTGANGDRGVQVLARPTRAQERAVGLKYQKDTNCIGLSMNCSLIRLPQVIKLVLSADGVIVAEIGAEHYIPQQLGRKIINDLLGIGFTGPVSQALSSEPPYCSVSCNGIEMQGRITVASASTGGRARAIG